MSTWWDEYNKPARTTMTKISSKDFSVLARAMTEFDATPKASSASFRIDDDSKRLIALISDENEGYDQPIILWDPYSVQIADYAQDILNHIKSVPGLEEKILLKSQEFEPPHYTSKNPSWAVISMPKLMDAILLNRQMEENPRFVAKVNAAIKRDPGIVFDISTKHLPLVASAAREGVVNNLKTKDPNHNTNDFMRGGIIGKKIRDADLCLAIERDMLPCLPDLVRNYTMSELSTVIGDLLGVFGTEYKNAERILGASNPLANTEASWLEPTHNFRLIIFNLVKRAVASDPEMLQKIKTATRQAVAMLHKICIYANMDEKLEGLDIDYTVLNNSTEKATVQKLFDLVGEKVPDIEQIVGGDSFSSKDYAPLLAAESLSEAFAGETLPSDAAETVFEYCGGNPDSIRQFVAQELGKFLAREITETIKKDTTPTENVVEKWYAPFINREMSGSSELSMILTNLDKHVVGLIASSSNHNVQHVCDASALFGNQDTKDVVMRAYWSIFKETFQHTVAIPETPYKMEYAARPENKNIAGLGMTAKSPAQINSAGKPEQVPSIS